jgi:hypothetical protein
MKTMLLILMTLASVAMANDAKIKARIVGTWRDFYTQKTCTFQADGEWLTEDDTGNKEPWEKWDVQGGKFIYIRPAPETALTCSILFITKREFLVRKDSHGEPYMFLTRP